MKHIEQSHGKSIIDQIRARDPRRLEIIEVGSRLYTIRQLQNIQRGDLAATLGTTEEQLKMLELGQSEDNVELNTLLLKCKNWLLSFPTL